MSRPVVALYVETDGCYFGVPGVEPWDETRDARRYAGPHPVVAHPPCQRWGRYWHGSPMNPHVFDKGSDQGCFAAAVEALKIFGGVIEHPADSHAWAHFGFNAPPRGGQWVWARPGFWTCCVYQGHYGHFAGKATWLLVSGVPRRRLPNLRWGPTEQRLDPVQLARHGYKKACRVGMMAAVGGKDKTKIRNATPPRVQRSLALYRPARLRG